MNRQEFIESCKDLSEKDLERIAIESRNRANGRIPAEVQRKFRDLDDETSVKEIFVPIDKGDIHLYLVSENDFVNRSGKEKPPVIVNVHGGGWSLDHTERDIYFSRRLAVGVHAFVIDVDYVLAPEYPYPAAIEQMESFFAKMTELIDEWGADSSRIVLCGQSAGGNLLAAVMLRHRFGEVSGIKGEILCYLPADNYNDHFNGGELDERGMSTEYYGFFYNRVFEERRNFDVSIVYAKPDEIRNLVDTDIITAGLDNLMPEGRKFYELIKENGIKANYRCFENSKHGFLVNLYDEWEEGEAYVLECIRKYI